ncbi:unnamed protein product [Hymenolepis diminuta]|uniref:FERM domain-containing protein n=1 Tax=Hymenolepis diminuta TaxID=6216 RepID=A0A564Z612_HYMDI|nr:unnamed protein product [Hymenolepis diminuta]
MDGTLNSKNGVAFQSKATLPDGTIEITDTLPKQDYYKSLRRTSASSPGSQFTINNSTNVYDATSGYRKSKAIDYKPSGKQVQCSVLMLEGVEQVFTIDKNFYGLHLFKMICEKLELTETEYFGLTYRGNQNVDMWLKMDEKISKQLEKIPWKFEFRFKFYPALPEYLKDDLTRYFLCLQVRQDLICGQLPCSFNTYVILGAYVIQSEAGDWDAEAHAGIEYIYNIPFAPKNLQTPEMLVRIAELHQRLKGRTPEQADRVFLENVRRLALYGVHLHRVKSNTGEDLALGVYHSGVLVYRGRLRMQHYTWARIVELSYKGKEFIMVVRPVIFDEYIESPGGRRRTSVSSRNASSSTERGTFKQRSRSAKPSADAHRNMTLTFKCLNSEMAKRLYNVVVDHHTFFRLREGNTSRRLNLQPGFGIRKYHYNSKPQIFDDSESGFWTLNRDGGLPPTSGGSIRRVAAQRRPEQYAKSLVTLMTPVASRKGAGFRAPCASIEDADSIKNGSQPSGGSNSIRTHESSMLMEEQYAPIKTSPDSPGAILANAAMNFSAKSPGSLNGQMEKKPPPVSPRMPRPELSRQHWQMSPADCTQGLGMDLYGTDVATMMDAGWQGSRTNRGIKGPGNYYYEVSVLEDGDIRVGWSTNDASLMLGMDAHGYGYGAAENGDGSYAKQYTMGRLVHNGEAHEMGFPAAVSNVIGCFLQLQKSSDGEGLEGNVMWSHNGQLVTSPHANLVRIPPRVATDSAFFPTVSLRDARISLNFGDKPFVHQPEQISGGRLQWTSPIEVPADKIVQNVNSGWRVNQFDTTSSLSLIVSEDGRMIQATDNKWQGFRANKGVFEEGKYYYEVEMVEDCGYARVGWSLPTANLQLGVDNLGYGYGCAPDGSPAKKVFNGVAEDYGVKFKVGDVVGCYLDLDNGTIQWSVNGEMLPPAYHMDSSFISHDKTIFLPSASLYCTTLEVNYGDRPFKYQPTEEWYPLFAAADEFVQDSPKWPFDINKLRQPHATTERVESDILCPDVTITISPNNSQLQSAVPLDSTLIEDTQSKKDTNGGGRRCSSEDEEDTVVDTRDEQAKGRESPIPLSTNRTDTQRMQVHNATQESTDTNNGNEDEALNKAINYTTQLDSESVVLNGSSSIRSDTVLTSPATGRTPL